MIFSEKAQYGIMFHYIAGAAGNGESYEPVQWKRDTESFDVEAVADAVIRSGAGYIIFTLGQNSGFYCAPNKVLDEITGCVSDVGCGPTQMQRRTSERDLPKELISCFAAKKADIGMILYLPSNPPAADEHTVSKFGWISGIGKYGNPAPQDIAAAERWYKVAGCWSENYGNSIDGWWIDGYYDENMHDPILLSSYLKKGNPNSLIAFNRGVNEQCLFDCEDYLAGEQNDIIYRYGAVDFGGKHKHVLTYLGENWGQGDMPRFSQKELDTAVQTFLNNNVNITFDVPITKNGTVPESFITALGLLQRT